MSNSYIDFDSMRYIYIIVKIEVLDTIFKTINSKAGIYYRVVLFTPRTSVYCCCSCFTGKRTGVGVSVLGDRGSICVTNIRRALGFM